MMLMGLLAKEARAVCSHLHGSGKPEWMKLTHIPIRMVSGYCLVLQQVMDAAWWIAVEIPTEYDGW